VKFLRSLSPRERLKDKLGFLSFNTLMKRNDIAVQS
jgi:hypothetical protein